MTETTKTCELIERLVLAEIDGKNRAIHAYDGMSWKIRTGFLTLLFGGWSILLQAIVQNTAQRPEAYRPLAWGLYLFSLGFALGAWYVDRSYVRRKFRVIQTLDRLTERIAGCDGDLDRIDPELLKVAGDNADVPFDSTGYREACKAELSVYVLPVVIVLSVVLFVV